MDLPNFESNLKEFKKAFPNLEIIPISALNRTGINEMVIKMADKVEKIEAEPLYEENKYESHVIYKFKNEKPYTITRDEEGVWIIKGEEIEKLLKMTKFQEDESVRRFARKLRGMGVDEELENLGAEKGDDVQILDFMFTFKE